MNQEKVLSFTGSITKPLRRNVPSQQVKFGWHIQLSETWINSASNIKDLHCNSKMKSEAPERELVVAV